MINLQAYRRARRKRALLREYIVKLRPLLEGRYGREEFYAPKQVLRAIDEAKLSDTEAVYALVLYCAPEAFAAYQKTHSGTAKYWELRVELTEYDFRHKYKWEPGDIRGDVGDTYWTSGDFGGHGGH